MPSIRDRIERSNIVKVLSGMEKAALEMYQERVGFYLEFTDKLIEALKAVYPMQGTAHKGECPHCRRVGHKVGCPIVEAAERVEAYTGESLHKEG